MAETAGLVIGAVSLAGLFTTCVDSFNYLRVGRAFADDFPIYQTEVNVLELRFSRWAQAVQQLSTEKNPIITNEVARLVERNLKDIAKLFKRAQEDGEEYVRESKTSQSLEIQDPLQTPEVSKLHVKLKSLVHHRQKTTRSSKISREFRWAIYKKDEFLELITKLRQKVDDLESITSIDAFRNKLTQMQIEDATEIQKEAVQDVRLVQESGEDVDPVFSNMLAKMDSRNTYDLIEIADEARVQMGETVAKDYNGPLSKASNSFRNVKVGKATVNMGNLHGRTVFDPPNNG